MSQENKKRSVGIQLLLMAAFVGVFLVGVSLVGGGFENRSSRFWVTISCIVFAQLVWFNVPVWLVATDARNKGSFPFQLTAVTFCTMYAAGVFAMALAVVFTDISSQWVTLGHLALLFLLAASLGMYSMAGRAIDSMDAADKRDKAGHQQLVSHVQSVCDRASMVESPLGKPAQSALGELQEAMQYASGESLPGSEGADAEIARHVSQIEGFLMDLDGAADDDATQGFVDQIVREVKLAKMAIDRREKLILSLR
jgi:hypothetical protein